MADVVTPMAKIARPTDDHPWAFLFALEREAKPFKRQFPDALIRVMGVGFANAASAAERVIDDHSPGAIIACGYSGGLRRDLAVGDVLHARDVIDESGHIWPCSAAQGQYRIISVGKIVSEPSQKSQLAITHQADAVDMESAVIARICENRNVAFGCVRAISDTAATQLSPKLVNLIANGQVSWTAAAMAVLRSPSLACEFMRLASHTRFAADQLVNALGEFLWHQDKSPHVSA